MSGDIPRPNPDDVTPGRHGNTSYGLAKAELQLQRGQPFDGALGELYHETLNRWGYADAELTGPRGDFIRLAARQYVITLALDGSQRMAGALGDVKAFFWDLENRYGRRREQAGRSLLKVVEMEEAEANTQTIDGLLSQPVSTEDGQ